MPTLYKPSKPHSLIFIPREEETFKKQNKKTQFKLLRGKKSYYTLPTNVTVYWEL